MSRSRIADESSRSSSLLSFFRSSGDSIRSSIVIFSVRAGNYEFSEIFELGREEINTAELAARLANETVGALGCTVDAEQSDVGAFSERSVASRNFSKSVGR